MAHLNNPEPASEPLTSKSVPYVSIKGVSYIVTCRPRRLWIPKFVYRQVIDDLHTVEFTKKGEVLLQLVRGKDKGAKSGN